MGSIGDENQAELFAQFQLFRQFLENNQPSHPKDKTNIAGKKIADDSEDSDSEGDSEEEFDEDSAEEDSDDLYGTQTSSNSIRQSRPNV